MCTYVANVIMTFDYIRSTYAGANGSTVNLFIQICISREVHLVTAVFDYDATHPRIHPHAYTNTPSSHSHSYTHTHPHTHNYKIASRDQRG